MPTKELAVVSKAEHPTRVENDYKFVCTHPETGECVGIPKERLHKVAQDGSWSDKGWELYDVKCSLFYLIHNWSKWQGDHNTTELICREEAIQYLERLYPQHPERFISAMSYLGAVIPEIGICYDDEYDEAFWNN